MCQRPLHLRVLRVLSGATLCAAAAAGCVTTPANPAATQPVTRVPVEQAEPAYWYAQPARYSVSATRYDALWDAAQAAARDLLLEVDRRDYRGGVMTTLPVPSGQFFEPWRGDAVSADDRAEASLATVRRTIRFEFTPPDDAAANSDGGNTQTFTVTPKVLVEREAVAERRITSVVRPNSISPNARSYGSRELDAGRPLPTQYYYPVGRDADLEHRVASAIRRHLPRDARVAAE